MQPMTHRPMHVIESAFYQIQANTYNALCMKSDIGHNIKPSLALMPEQITNGTNNGKLST